MVPNYCFLPIVLVVLLGYGCAPSQAHYFFASSIHEAFRGVLPAEVSVFYVKLSAQELEMIKSAGQQLDQGIGDEPALQALKSMDEPLFTRVVQSRDAISQKIDSLPADAREFVNGVIAKARELRPASGQSVDMAQTRVQAAKIVAEFNELSDDAKRVLALMFPEIVAGIECAEFQGLATAGKNAEEHEEL